MHLIRRAAFAMAALLTAVPLEAGAACDCQDTNNDGYPDTGGSCTQATPAVLTYTASSGNGLPADSVSVTIADIDGDGRISCGMYAVGDYWIVGEGGTKSVNVTSTSPAPGGGNDGWMVNPGLDENRLDAELDDYQAPPSTPQQFSTLSGPVSFVKAKSATEKDDVGTSPYGCQDTSQNSRSCLQFAGVFTFVNAAPSNSHPLFRPPVPGPAATKWTGFRTTSLNERTTAFPSLSNPGGGAPTLESVAKRGRWPHIGGNTRNLEKQVQQWMARHNYGENYCPQKTSYGGNFACSDATAVTRLLLSDFDRNIPHGSSSWKAVVGLVQSGLDILAGVRQGAGWGPGTSKQAEGRPWGSILTGRKLRPWFAAYVLDDPELKGLITANNGGAWFTHRLFQYRSGVPLQGWSKAEHSYCPTLANNCSSGVQWIRQNCIPAAMDRDAACCSDTKGYPLFNNSGAINMAMPVILMDATAGNSGDPSQVWGNDAYLDFALGYGPGATSRKGIVEGRVCSASGGETSSGTVDIDQQTNSFLNAMWDVHIASGVDPISPSPPPPTGGLQAPTLLP